MAKTCLVSGANRGIGLQIAEQLRASGYQLSLGMRDPSAFDHPLAIDEQVQCCAYEATDGQSPRQWVARAVERFGGIDAVILCAGILRIYTIDNDDESDLDEMWHVNVKGPLRLIRAALPALKQSGEGRVINMVSMSGKRVKGVSAGYAMSKYANMALSDTVRNIGWEHGIRATAVCPGWVNTDMAAFSQVPAEAMTQPEDLARLVVTVLSLPNNAVVPELAVQCELEK